MNPVQSRWLGMLDEGRRGMRLAFDIFDLHELYTLLVEPNGSEGCNAGCTILPEGWCRNCDHLREARMKLRRVQVELPPGVAQEKAHRFISAVLTALDEQGLELDSVSNDGAGEVVNVKIRRGDSV